MPRILGRCSQVRSSYTKPLDLFEDGVGIGSPFERCRLLVVVGQIIPDSSLEFTNTAKGAAPDAAFGQQAEEALNLIEPTGAGGSEVQMIPGPAREPALHLGHFVGSVVVHYQMNFKAFRNRGVDLFQEAQELLMSLPMV